MTASSISLEVAEIEALLARIEPQIAKEDYERLTSIARTLIEVTRLARRRGATIKRLLRMLGQASSEKTANVVGSKGAAASNTS